MEIVNGLYLVLAVVGACVVGVGIYTRGWQPTTKVLAMVLLVGGILTMLERRNNLTGLINPITVIFALVGIGVTSVYAFRRVGNDWRARALVVSLTAVTLIPIVWQILRRPMGTFPSIPGSASAASASSSLPISVVPTRSSHTRRALARRACDSMPRPVCKHVSHCVYNDATATCSAR